jgi:predicted amidohydrolase YtcJ
MGYAEKRLGERARNAYTWRTLLKSGVPYIPLSSDFPVEDPNPFHGLYAAITRSKDGDSVLIWY